MKQVTVCEKDDDKRTTSWEAMCQPSGGCGTMCCFYEGSPCEELRWVDRKKGIGVCTVYSKRHGYHKTLEGKEFVCSDMGTWLKYNIPHERCGYRGIVRVDGQLTLEGKFRDAHCLKPVTV